MDKDTFLRELRREVANLGQIVATDEGDWIIKGFIDIARNIYTVSVDTKVISKVMELLLLPELARFAKNHGLEMFLAQYQNFYPDISFVDEEGHRFALDLKSTYRVDSNEVNGMTLGCFTGYFRDRSSTKNITFSYNSYVGHFVLGVIYSKADGEIDERRKYSLDELEFITSVITNFEFFVQEKYLIASDRPGSGNTKNIGSIIHIPDLVSGKGPFAKLGIDVFDDYWMYYLTADMARAVEMSRRPYTNLSTYLRYKGMKS